MHSMKDITAQTGISYETLKFYCNEGLIPNVQRNENNHRVFTDENLEWINSLTCLRNTGMTIREMKQFAKLIVAGDSTIPCRLEILDAKRAQINLEISKLEHSLAYIDAKEKFYNELLTNDQATFTFFEK